MTRDGSQRHRKKKYIYIYIYNLNTVFCFCTSEFICINKYYVKCIAVPIHCIFIELTGPVDTVDFSPHHVAVNNELYRYAFGSIYSI